MSRGRKRQSATPKPKSAPQRSWSFWKKRLAKALIVGGVVLLATQIVPNFPQDQRLLVRAPPGRSFKHLRLTYFKEGETEALGGAELSFPGPVSQIPYGMSLPNGRYLVQLDAKGESSQEHWIHRAYLQLSGGTTIVHFLPQP